MVVSGMSKSIFVADCIVTRYIFAITLAKLSPRWTPRMTASRSKVTLADYRLLAELRYSLRLFASFSEEAAKSVGLHSTQHQALLAIKGFPGPGPASVGELAERLCVRHHSAVELVDRLIDEGYVRRTPDPADRRRVLLSLTARGEKILERLSLAHRDELTRIGPHIESLLERLRARAEAKSARPRKGASKRARAAKRGGDVNRERGAERSGHVDARTNA